MRMRNLRFCISVLVGIGLLFGAVTSRAAEETSIVQPPNDISWGTLKAHNWSGLNETSSRALFARAQAVVDQLRPTTVSGLTVRGVRKEWWIDQTLCLLILATSDNGVAQDAGEVLVCVTNMSFEPIGASAARLGDVTATDMISGETFPLAIPTTVTKSQGPELDRSRLQIAGTSPEHEADCVAAAAGAAEGAALLCPVVWLKPVAAALAARWAWVACMYGSKPTYYDSDHVPGASQWRGSPGGPRN